MAIKKKKNNCIFFLRGSVFKDKRKNIGAGLRKWAGMRKRKKEGEGGGRETETVTETEREREREEKPSLLNPCTILEALFQTRLIYLLHRLELCNPPFLWNPTICPDFPPVFSIVQSWPFRWNVRSPTITSQLYPLYTPTPHSPLLHQQSVAQDFASMAPGSPISFPVPSPQPMFQNPVGCFKIQWFKIQFQNSSRKSLFFPPV